MKDFNKEKLCGIGVTEKTDSFTHLLQFELQN